MVGTHTGADLEVSRLVLGNVGESSTCHHAAQSGGSKKEQCGKNMPRGEERTDTADDQQHHPQHSIGNGDVGGALVTFGHIHEVGLSADAHPCVHQGETEVHSDKHQIGDEPFTEHIGYGRKHHDGEHQS